MIPFAKGHGLGNDYIVINGAELRGPHHSHPDPEDLRPELGGDRTASCSWFPHGGADFGLRYFIRMGARPRSPATVLRIFAKYHHDMA
jgi:hypothetical protein